MVECMIILIASPTSTCGRAVKEAVKNDVLVTHLNLNNHGPTLTCKKAVKNGVLIAHLIIFTLVHDVSYLLIKTEA